MSHRPAKFSRSAGRDGFVGSPRSRRTLIVAATMAAATLTAAPAETGPEPVPSAPEGRAPRTPERAGPGTPPETHTVRDWPAGAVLRTPAPAAPTAAPAAVTVWDALAECESNGDWSINTGNGYYGGVQFSLRSWRWVGGSGYPHQASKAEQIHRAEHLLALQGWGAWPACSRKLGLRP